MHLLLHSRIQPPLRCPAVPTEGWQCPQQPRLVPRVLLQDSVGSARPAAVGLGAAVWAAMLPACLPPQTSQCWAGPPLLRGQSPLSRIDRHGLFNMHITRQGIAPLRLPPALPPPALSFPRAALPRGLPALCCHLCRVRVPQERDEASPFPPHFSCPEFALH